MKRHYLLGVQRTGPPSGPPPLSNVIRQRRRSGGETPDVANLFLAGDYMQMPSVNGALASGVDAADAVSELFGSRPS